MPEQDELIQQIEQGGNEQPQPVIAPEQQPAPAINPSPEPLPPQQPQMPQQPPQKPAEAPKRNIPLIVSVIILSLVALFILIFLIAGYFV